VGLRPFACWDCGFESRRGHECLVSCECCVLSGRGLCLGLITRPEESYRVWCVLSECDREASIMRRPWLTKGCCAIGRKKCNWCRCPPSRTISTNVCVLLYPYAVLWPYINTAPTVLKTSRDIQETFYAFNVKLRGILVVAERGVKLYFIAWTLCLVVRIWNDLVLSCKRQLFLNLCLYAIYVFYFYSSFSNRWGIAGRKPSYEPYVYLFTEKRFGFVKKVLSVDCECIQGNVTGSSWKEPPSIVSIKCSNSKFYNSAANLV
jgi:hypothetical protein